MSDREREAYERRLQEAGTRIHQYALSTEVMSGCLSYLHNFVENDLDPNEPNMKADDQCDRVGGANFYQVCAVIEDLCGYIDSQNS